MVLYRVMLVSEDSAVRSAITALLKNWHYDVFPAADSLDALRQIYYVSPQIIVSDAGLGNCAGFELLPFLRRRFPEMGVIVLSQEPAPAEEAPDKIMADETIPATPLNPELLGKALLGLCARYPFRREDEAENLHSSPSGGRGNDSKMQPAPSAQSPKMDPTDL